MNIYEVFSRDIIENRRLIYDLLLVLAKKGIISTGEMEKIRKGVEDGLKDQSEE